VSAHDKEMVSRRNWGIFLRLKESSDFASIEEIVFEIGCTDSNSTLSTNLAVRRFVPEITLVHAQEIYSVFFGN